MAESREIPLTQGKVTIVDAEDYEFLSAWKWCAHKGPYTFYALRGVRKPNGKQTLIRMHRAIMLPAQGMEIDHRNGNGLDNRRSNLRICTHQENARNCKLRKDNTSGCTGVHWNAQNKTWDATIKINETRLFIGSYADINEAVAVRRAKERELFSEFVRE